MASRRNGIARRQFLRGVGGTAVGAAALGAGGGLLAACSGSTTATQKQATIPLNRDPNTFVLAVDAFLPDFDPASYFLLSGIVANYGMYEGLLRMKAGSATEVEPVLAESWQTNADKSAWTFALRPGVKYSDGTPFDASALKAAYTRTITAGLGAGSTLSTYISDAGKQIVVKDPGTVVFDLGLPVPRFDLLMASQYGTSIVNPSVNKQGATTATPIWGRTPPAPAPTWSTASLRTTRWCSWRTPTTGEAGAGSTSRRSSSARWRRIRAGVRAWNPATSTWPTRRHRRTPPRCGAHPASGSATRRSWAWST